jgi:hypothetical protein
MAVVLACLRRVDLGPGGFGATRLLASFTPSFQEAKTPDTPVDFGAMM